MKVITLEELHSLFKKHLHIEDINRLDALLAVCLSNKNKEGVLLWLIFVGPSGDGKSELFYTVIGGDVYLMHKLTSNTLVNGFANKKKFPDLAPELDGKILLIPDMSEVLQLHPNEKAQVWAQLRNLYDGYAGKDSGQGSRKKYEGLRVTLLAGSTTAIDAQILIHQSLGTRELVYRSYGSKDQNKAMDKCLENEEKDEAVRKELKEATLSFLEAAKVIRKEIPKDIEFKIKEIASYTAKMRTSAEFDYHDELRNLISPEQPTRLVKQLKRLYVHLMSLDPNYSSDNAIKILEHIGRSSANPVRVEIYELLKTQKIGISTSSISNRLHIGKSTANRECAVLKALGLIINDRNGTPGDNSWRIRKDEE